MYASTFKDQLPAPGGSYQQVEVEVDGADEEAALHNGLTDEAHDGSGTENANAFFRAVAD